MKMGLFYAGAVSNREGKIFVFGGQDASFRPTDYACYYDTNIKLWVDLPKIPIKYNGFNYTKTSK